jgi:hypothetical protein
MKPVVALLALLLAAPALAEKTEGVIPGVLFGPKVGIVSFPAPSVGIEAKLGGWFGLSYDYGYVPDFKVKEVTLGWSNWSAGAKVFPFRGSFFLGALYGQRSLRLRAVDKSTPPLEASGRITSNYVAPELGWRFIGDTGFTMGIDLGWQLVTSHSARLTIPGGYDAQKEKDVRDLTDAVGKAGIPVLGLLQLGWMF